MQPAVAWGGDGSSETESDSEAAAAVPDLKKLDFVCACVACARGRVRAPVHAARRVGAPPGWGARP